MFMLVHVSVIIPGLSLYSMSLKCGLSTIAVTGITWFSKFKRAMIRFKTSTTQHEPKPMLGIRAARMGGRAIRGSSSVLPVQGKITAGIVREEDSSTGSKNIHTLLEVILR